MEDRRSRAIEYAVDFPALREICDLCRAAEITSGRQQVVLHDGAENDTRAEATGFLLAISAN